MNTPCWRQVGKDDLSNNLGEAAQVITFEREVPFGKLVMVVTRVGYDKVTTALTFVQYPEEQPKGVRKV